MYRISRYWLMMSLTNLPLLVADSIIFEAMGTFAELFTADELLRGRSPMHDFKTLVRFLRRKICGGEKGGKVEAVVDSGSDSDVSLAVLHALSRGQAGSFKAAKETTTTLAKFCGTSMILLNICEASAILTTTGFWLTNRRMAVSR